MENAQKSLDRHSDVSGNGFAFGRLWNQDYRTVDNAGFSYI
jgi:hypothetical protein